MIQILLLRDGDGNQPRGHMHPVGFPTGLVVSNTDALFKNLGAILDKLRAADPENLKNVYYTVAHHAGLGGSLPVRNETSFEYQSILQLDIDAIDQTKVWDYLPIVAKLLGVSPQSLIFVSTGNGIHIIAHLKTPIRSAKYLKETKPHYNELIYKINQELSLAGLPGQADPAVWDSARILRLPNTINDSKKKGVKEAKLLQYPGLVPLDLDIIKVSGLDIKLAENINPQQLKKSYPRPDFQTVMSECEFLKWFAAHPNEVHEPQFMSAVGLLSTMHPADKALCNGQELTAKDMAQSVFDNASSSKSLGQGSFERKWEHSGRYGAPKCQTVSQNWIGGCERCPHYGKINTPLALKSDLHISSEANGYWVINANNKPAYPHYSDLAKLYRSEKSYVVCDPERLFTFTGTHYTPTSAFMIKSWLEKNTGYEEHLREAHRVEFVKKLLCSNVVDPDSEKILFEQTIRGKLNCQNGMVDVLNGDLLTHTPSVGFKYVLPYAYEPGGVSELFLDWLAEMLQNRIELMDSMLDMMAYCLWPSYDDHVFAYLVGEGRNGKSTVLRIMQALLGRDNYSAISLAQLGGNRFAPANLEGKLANISEESSGSDLTFEELNIIKDLSAGGEIQVERKREQGFLLRNPAKLIFSANKTPRFHESGKAIRSRLLVIPFEHTIENPDENVAKKLLAEVPKICNMLVARIQENVKANNGKFLVSRGGNAAFLAQEKVLLSGNSVFEWGRDHVESSLSFSEEQYIVCHEAYSRYANWCQENNYKPMNSKSFGQTMLHGVLSGAVKNSTIRKVGGNPVRIYPRTQWKEVIL